MLIEHPAPCRWSREHILSISGQARGSHTGVTESRGGGTWPKQGALPLNRPGPQLRLKPRKVGRSMCSAVSTVPVSLMPSSAPGTVGASQTLGGCLATQPSGSSLSVAERCSVLRPHPDLTTVDSGVGSAAPPAADLRTCTVVVPGPFLRSVLQQGWVSRRPPPCPLKEDLGPWSPSRGGQGLCPSGPGLSPRFPLLPGVSGRSLWPPRLSLHL